MNTLDEVIMESGFALTERERHIAATFYREGQQQNEIAAFIEVRNALGDPHGKLMQDEIVAKVQQLAEPTVYEVVDESDSEVYYPVGVFCSFERALEFLDIYKDCPKSLCETTEYQEESITATIRRRDYGSSGVGVSVYHRLWDSVCDGDTERWEWRDEDLRSKLAKGGAGE